MQRAICMVILVGFIFTWGAVVAAQQAHSANDSSSSIWLAYIGEHPMSAKWNLHLEGQVFTHGPVQSGELIFVRPGLRRVFAHGLSVMVNYSYFLKYPALTSASQILPEHRISEDFQWTHPLAGEGAERLTLAHRLRAEQRFETRENPSDRSKVWDYAERFRYRIAAHVPLPKNSASARPDYVSVYNEVFLNFGRHSGKRAFDQNLVAGAIGWQLTSHFQAEIGYLLEYFPSNVGAVGRYNHAVQINFNSSLPFARGKR